MPATTATITDRASSGSPYLSQPKFPCKKFKSPLVIELDRTVQGSVLENRAVPSYAPIRILVIAAVRLYREGLAEVLGRTSGLTVVAALPDGREALARIGELAAHIVLLDMTLPDSHAIVRELGQDAPTIPIVALGVGESEAEIIACAEAGITGYLTHEASLEDLVGVIEAASRGEVICSPQLAAALVRRLAALAAQQPDVPQPRFTRREREVASLLQRDLTNKEIASRLGIEVTTVKNHVHNLLEKLSVHRRAEAARLLGQVRRGAVTTEHA